MSVLFSTGLSKFISGEQLHSQGTLEAGGFNLPPPLPPAPQHPTCHRPHLTFCLSFKIVGSGSFRMNSRIRIHIKYCVNLLSFTLEPSCPLFSARGFQQKSWRLKMQNRMLVKLAKSSKTRENYLLFFLNKFKLITFFS